MTDADSHIAVLWSGGFDSTVMVYLLASKGYSVKPYHILIRNKGHNKDRKETQAVDDVWDYMKDTYPNVEQPTHVGYRIRPCDDRNRKMIEFIRDRYGENSMALGSYTDPSRLAQDNDSSNLSKVTGCDITTFNTFDVNSKLEIASLIAPLHLENAIDKTWSCQLWWNDPCGKCYSCKERADALKSINLDKTE